jgi:AcrR family transcriptional regulator
MAYEVIKTIRGRDYRYAVESYRDPETGKVRNKWRYVGKAEGDVRPRRRMRAEETKAQLIAALERLLARRTWHEITAHEIAAEAGVSPATFYRYFPSRSDVLHTAAASSHESLETRLSELGAIADTPERERERLRAWTIAMINDPPGAAVLLALRSAGLPRDNERRDEFRRRAFVQYLDALRARGYLAIVPERIEGLALSLALVVQAFNYRALFGQQQLRANEIAALADAVERLIFG